MIGVNIFMRNLVLYSFYYSSSSFDIHTYGHLQFVDILQKFKIFRDIFLILKVS